MWGNNNLLNVFVVNLNVKRKVWFGIILGLAIFLFLVIKLSKTEKAELVDLNNSNNFVELVRVVGGDTIEVKMGNKIESVRLIGIDAPEMNEETRERAIESKQYLENLLKNQKIYLEKDETQDDRDVYNRLLRYVYLRDRSLINKKMIEAGMAKEFTFIYPYKYQREFRELEE